MTKRSIMIAGRPIKLWEYDPEGWPVMILVGAPGENCRRLARLAAQLAGYHLIVPEVPVLDRLAMSAWLDELVETLDVGDWISFSYSYGAGAALLQAASGIRPPLACVCVSPTGIITDAAGYTRQTYLTAAQVLPSRMKRIWLSRALTGAHKGWLGRRWPAQDTADGCDLWGPVATLLRIPTLVIAGNRDRMVKVGQLAPLVRQARRAQLVVMLGQGHGSPMAMPQATAMLVRRYVSELKLAA